MNCKPDQMAWIKVPPAFARHGVEHLQNRVVKTKELVRGTPSPTWLVEPPQFVQLTGSIKDAAGTTAKAGQRFEFYAIPDYWLVPFDPNSEPLNEPALRILEQTL
jgi:hypothetical protein